MTEYSKYIDGLLKPKVQEPAVVLDLFAGCGGLSLGFEAVGFRTIGFEMVDEAVDTYNRNLKGKCYNQFLEVGFDYPEVEDIDIIIGGPPCQPFSRFGNQKGMEDARDGFPIFIDAVRRIQPKVFLFENVANILGRHKWYLDLIVQELQNLGYIVEYKVLYLKEARSLKEELERKRNLMKVPVTLPGGKQISLSYGEHNDLQKAIIEKFLPLFGFGAEVLYVGDTKEKFLHMEEKVLKEIRFFVLEHDELPDVVAYSHEKNLLYLIEAYHSTGEWNEIRVRKVKRKLKESGCTADVVFFTAFETKNAFKQKAKDIAWETEVWIAESPEHLVHFNGYKFLDIHK